MADQVEIHMMASSKDVEERREATRQLRENFSGINDKKQAWDDLHRLTFDTDIYVRGGAASALGSAFINVPDKKQAWDDLHRLTSDNDNCVRWGAAEALGIGFLHLPEQKQAWDDLHRLTSDIYSDVRWRAAFALGMAFSHVLDKKQAWKDLHKLTSNNDRYVLRGTADALGVAFADVSDKQQAWEDLIRLTSITDSFVRRGAAEALGSVFAIMPDKQQAWEDLHRLTYDTYSEVRRRVVSAIGISFAIIPDKQEAWEDIHRLTSDTDIDVCRHAASAIGIAFDFVPDKEQAWEDLHRLTYDTDIDVCRHAASAIGSAFANVPNKQQACDDLHRLTSDNNNDVRASAYHSMGKVSIFKAANAENSINLKKEMEEAIRYFEKSSKQDSFSKPAKFCLPFYRSFYSITFKKEKPETEVYKYIQEAKRAVGGSESKEQLIEVVENLGNALKEAQKVPDFKVMKSKFNAYRRYCDRACELLETTVEKAPGASRLIMRGLPIIDERIKGIIAEIQQKARALCKQVKDTEFKEIGQQANHIGQELLKIRDPIALEKGVKNMLMPLSDICKKMPKRDRGEACKLLEKIDEEQYVEDKLPLISMVLSKISTQINLKKEQTMGNIKIDNSNGVQVSIGKDNKQVQGPTSQSKKVPKSQKDLQTKKTQKEPAKSNENLNLSGDPEKELGTKITMSPIELFFQEKQDTIRELAKKFSTYLNRPSVINEEVIKGWLLQFGNLIRIKFALRLLENIDYYEPWQMKQIFIHFYEKIIDENDRDKIVISLLGNPKDSSSIVNYTLGEEIMGYKLETHPLEAILNSMNPDKKLIVFIDDNIGSGKQAVQIFREWLGIEKRDLNESHVKPLSYEQIEKFKRFRIYLCTFVGFEDGKDNVSVELKKMGLNVVKVYSFSKLEEEIGCFHKALKTFDNEEERMQAENMAREIGFQLFEDKDWPDEIKNKRSLGYGNSQKLIVFYYNTPTSTLPILWKEGRYNGKKWLPLFPRREKK